MSERLKGKPAPVYLWWFTPFYDGIEGMPGRVWGHNLDYAFQHARSFWPTATSWRCDGRVDDKSLDKTTGTDRGWEERLVRISPDGKRKMGRGARKPKVRKKS